MSLPPFGLVGVSWTLSATGLLILAVHIVPYVVDAHGARSIPGPWLAKFTDAWLGRVAARGHRSEVVHELHKKYGESTLLSPPIHHLHFGRSPELTILFLRFPRNICPTCPKSCVNRRSRRPPDCLRPWERNFEERFLRYIRVRPPGAQHLQYP